MSNSFKPPPEFIETSEPAEAWREWKQMFEIYAVASNLTDKPVATQVAIFLNHLGRSGLKLYNNFSLATTATLGEVLLAFDNYYRPYRNITHLSYIFFTSKQSADMSIDQFILDQKTKAKLCEFGTLTDRLVRDSVICGILDNDLRQKLLALSDPTLAEVTALCRAAEQAKQQNAAMAPCSSLSERLEVNALKLPHSNIYKSESASIKGTSDNRRPIGSNGWLCYNCGRNHPPKKCAAFGKKCLNCDKFGHFAKLCRQKMVHAIVKKANFGAEEQDEEYFVGSIRSNRVGGEWFETITLNSKPVNFKLDTGSDINVLPISLVRNWSPPLKMTAHKARAVGFSGHSVPIEGKIQASLRFGDKSIITDFYVTSLDQCPILNGSTSVDLGLVSRLHSLTELPEQDATKILIKYEDVFDKGLGKLNNTYHITLHKDAKPVIVPTRTIPQALHEPVLQELNRMEKNGVVMRVHEPTDWVNALLPIQKNGKIKIVLDPRPLNKYIRRPHHPIPNLDSILEKLRGSTVFTVLDGRDAFWQMVLDEESSFLCTFSTPFGRYRFLRVPYGISAAPEFQQCTMDRLCEGLPGTAAFFDDIIIGGKDIRDHNYKLEKFLARARKAGLHLKSEKTQLAKSKVTFVGNRISAAGVEPGEEKLNAIVALETPASRKELQRFLGLLAYLGKYIPNLAEKAAYLRSLLRPNTPWSWPPQAESDFIDLKHLVNKAPVLAHFDPKCPLTLSVDASTFGVGAVILQNTQPLGYASATLSVTQQKYAQIEKEMLAIVYGCTRFHYYTYGRPILVETDHKPLISIVNKPLDSISPRLQRMILRLQRYSVSLVYTPGKNLQIADTLSRSPAKVLVHKETDDEDIVVHTISLEDQHSTPTHDELRQALSQDLASRDLVATIQAGWPLSVRQLPLHLHIYWKIRNELHVMDGLIFCGTKLLIPVALRRSLLCKIHESHQGIVACKARAGEHLFWPGMKKQIEDLVLNCHHCQKFSSANHKEPLQQHPLPAGPWQRIAIDLFNLGNKTFLIITDYYSKFIELIPLGGSTTANVIIEALKSVFSRHGIPLNIVSDNGPPFNSMEFKRFANEWNFKLITSSPRYPQSNGLVERSVRTIKSQLKKTLSAGNDPYKVVLNYVSTPHDDLPPPSVLLMARRLRTSLPGFKENYKQILPSSTTESILRGKRRSQAHYFNRNAKPLSVLSPNAPIYARINCNQWEWATVLKKADSPRSYWIKTSEGKLYRRNRCHLRVRKNMSAGQIYHPVHLPIPSMQPNHMLPLITPATKDSNESKDMTQDLSVITPNTLDQEPLSTCTPEGNCLDQPLSKSIQGDVQEIIKQGVVTPPIVTRSGRAIVRPLRFQD